MAKDYIVVNIEDIIKYARKASLEKRNDISAKLTQYFAKSSSIDIKINKNTEEAMYIIQNDKKYDDANYINLETLSLAFSRLSLDKSNKELLNRIKKYLFDFRQNIKEGESNTVLKNIIIDDTEVFNYIKEFSSFTEYEESIACKKLKKEDKQIVKIDDLHIKGKSII